MDYCKHCKYSKYNESSTCSVRGSDWCMITVHEGMIAHDKIILAERNVNEVLPSIWG